MVDDGQIVLLVGAIHVIALSLVGVLMWGIVKSRAADQAGRSDAEADGEADGGGGGGGNDRLRPPDRPRGGPPLPDAQPAPVRLRGPGRLSELLPEVQRRPAREPARRPVPSGEPRSASPRRTV